MNAEQFVAGLARSCRDAAVTDCVKNFENPPGRKPDPGLAELSRWWSNLPAPDREFVQRAMLGAAHATLFGVLCVIDGVRTIETAGPKSEFVLTAIRDGAESKIAPGEADLHDILRTNP